MCDSSIEEDFEKCFKGLTLQPYQFEPERTDVSSENENDEECDNNVIYRETELRVDNLSWCQWILCRGKKRSGLPMLYTILCYLEDKGSISRTRWLLQNVWMGVKTRFLKACLAYLLHIINLHIFPNNIFTKNTAVCLFNLE